MLGVVPYITPFTSSRLASGSPSAADGALAVNRGKPDPEPRPDLPYERALPALERQLQELQKLKDRSYDDAGDDETAWQHFTESLLERTFGKGSTYLSKFTDVSWIGANLFGHERSPHELQSIFERRISHYQALLTSVIAELRLYVPDQPIKGVYEPGDRYDVYRDLSAIISAATREIIIVDGYLDEQIFNLYVDKVADDIPVHILSNKIGQNVETIAQMFASRRPLELRANVDVHDRMLFVDDRGWVIGQSLKDAAKTKPTYLVEVEGQVLAGLRGAYDTLWSNAKVIVLI